MNSKSVMNGKSPMHRRSTFCLLVSALALVATVVVLPATASAGEGDRTDTVAVVQVDAREGDDILTPMEKYCLINHSAEDYEKCVSGQPVKALAALELVLTDRGEPVIYHAIGSFDEDWLCENAPSSVLDFCKDFAWCVLYTVGCNQGSW